MFNLAEKVVLTFLSLSVALLIAALGLHVAGLELEGVAVAVIAFASLATGVLFGFVAFLKYLWFDA